MFMNLNVPERPSGGPGLLQGYHMWFYEVPWDIGYDFCRPRRELPEYTKITQHCSEKKWYFYGVKNRVLLFLHLRPT